MERKDWRVVRDWVRSLRSRMSQSGFLFLGSLGKIANVCCFRFHCVGLSLLGVLCGWRAGRLTARGEIFYKWHLRRFGANGGHGCELFFRAPVFLFFQVVGFLASGVGFLGQRD